MKIFLLPSEGGEVMATLDEKQAARSIDGDANGTVSVLDTSKLEDGTAIAVEAEVKFWIVDGEKGGEWPA